MNIHFYSPGYLYLLLALIPLLGLSLFAYWRRRWMLKRFADKDLGRALTPLASGKKYVLRDLLLLIAGALIIVVLARPQVAGGGDAANDDKGIDARICVDISNSMLCQDIAPSRLDFAKRTISRLLERMHSDRVGVIVFAGSAFVQLPMTTDLGTAQDFLADISPNMLSDQGTAIGQAIMLARQSFSDRKDLGKSIIVLTDGEDFEDNATEAAKDAAKAGIHINVVGIGSDKGGPIPTSEGNLTDESGNMVVTRFNPDMCQQIADAGAGVFVSSSAQSTVVKEIEKQLEELPRASITSRGDNSAAEAFEPWLWAALVLLVVEFFIMGRKNKFLIRHNIFGNEK